MWIQLETIDTAKKQGTSELRGTSELIQTDPPAAKWGTWDLEGLKESFQVTQPILFTWDWNSGLLHYVLTTHVCISVGRNIFNAGRISKNMSSLAEQQVKKWAKKNINSISKLWIPGSIIQPEWARLDHSYFWAGQFPHMYVSLLNQEHFLRLIPTAICYDSVTQNFGYKNNNDQKLSGWAKGMSSCGDHLWCNWVMLSPFKTSQVSYCSCKIPDTHGSSASCPWFIF